MALSISIELEPEVLARLPIGIYYKANHPASPPTTGGRRCGEAEYPGLEEELLAASRPPDQHPAVLDGAARLLVRLLTSIRRGGCWPGQGYR